MDGSLPYEQLGWSVASAGDVNSDGYPDLLVGTEAGGKNGSYSGINYLIYGKGGGFGNIDLATFENGSGEGFRIDGEAGSMAGRSAGAGDLNGDGYDDIVVGANDYNMNQFIAAGAGYVIFGAPTPPTQVAGRIFMDTNGNGQQDAGEPGAAAAAVQVTMGNGDTTTVLTNASGDYVVEVRAGTVSVSTGSDFATGCYRRTTFNDEPQTINAVTQQTVQVAPVGYQRRSLIYGTIFNDVDQNADWDFNEPSLASVSVNVSTADGMTSVTTDVFGTFAASVPEGEAVLWVEQTTLPPGSVSTTFNYVQVLQAPACESVYAEPIGYRIIPDPCADLSAEWRRPPVGKCKEKHPRCKIKGQLMVRNGGGADTWQNEVNYYISEDRTLDSNDTWVGAGTIPALSAGSPPRKVNVFIHRALPVDVAGKYLIAVLDADNTTNECNERDNILPVLIESR
jgi:hypothetical protein